jgi:hypothetical protein
LNEDALDLTLWRTPFGRGTDYRMKELFETLLMGLFVNKFFLSYPLAAQINSVV